MRPPKYKVGDKVSFMYNNDRLSGTVIEYIDVPDDVTFRYIYTIKVKTMFPFPSWKYRMYEDSLLYVNLDEMVNL